MCHGQRAEQGESRSFTLKVLFKETPTLPEEINSTRPCEAFLLRGHDARAADCDLTRTDRGHKGDGSAAPSRNALQVSVFPGTPALPTSPCPTHLPLQPCPRSGTSATCEASPGQTGLPTKSRASVLGHAQDHVSSELCVTVGLLLSADHTHPGQTRCILATTVFSLPVKNLSSTFRP